MKVNIYFNMVDDYKIADMLVEAKFPAIVHFERCHNCCYEENAIVIRGSLNEVTLTLCGVQTKTYKNIDLISLKEEIQRLLEKI